MNSHKPPFIDWIVDPHPQREAMVYTIRILGILMGRPVRLLENTTNSGSGQTVVHYGKRSPSDESQKYTIVPDGHFWSRVESGADISPAGVSEWQRVMFPRWVESGVSRKVPSSSAMLCPVDPVASAFFLISRIEEHRNEVVDEHGRFPADNSWMVRMGLIERPLVHDYAAILLEALTGEQRPELSPSPWPEGHKFALSFTHDVDRLRMHGSLWRDFRSGIGGLRFRGGVVAGFRRAKSCLKTRLLAARDPYNTIHEILDGQERRGIRSTWFWIATNPSIRDADYNPADHEASAVITEIQTRGHEIALHGSYASGENPELLRQEKVLLESVTKSPVHSTRQHYLRFRADRTWSGQRSVGLTIDSTLGFAGRMGFRAGLAIPFKPWNFANGSCHDLWEVPLVIMDVTAREYMGLAPGEAIAKSRQIFATISRIGGAAAVLWHNSSLNEIDWRGWRPTYDSWLDAAAEFGAWSATMSEIVERWKLYVRAWDSQS